VAVGSPGVTVAGGVKVAKTGCVTSGDAVGVGDKTEGSVGGATTSPARGAASNAAIPMQ